MKDANRLPVSDLWSGLSCASCHEEHDVQLIRVIKCSKISETASSSSLIVVSFDVLRNRPIVFYFDKEAEGDMRTGYATIRRSLEKSAASSVGNPLTNDCRE